MNEFSYIPLTPTFLISTSGKILPDCLSIEIINDQTFILLGSSDGELWLYTIDNEIPKKHASSLGGIAIVTFKHMTRFKKTVAIVITLENFCYFFEIEGNQNEWRPIVSQALMFNPSCYVIFEGKTGCEILLGTQNGGLGYFVENSKGDPVWRYSNFWSFKYEVTSIVQVNNETFLIGRGDGNAIMFNIKENPERITNVMAEIATKDPNYVLLTHNKMTDKVLAVNGQGKLSLFNFEGKGDVVSVNIKKRPIFVGFWNNELGQEIAVVGTPDGCVYFLSGALRNLYRHEELVQSVYLAKSQKFILVLVGQSGMVSFFTKLTQLDNRIPRFAQYAKADIEAIRALINDRDTPDEAFISTYLYMPFP